MANVNNLRKTGLNLLQRNIYTETSTEECKLQKTH